MNWVCVKWTEYVNEVLLDLFKSSILFSLLVSFVMNTWSFKREKPRDMCFQGLSFYFIYLFIYLMSCRWFGVPGHAPSAATAHQEPEQRHSGPSEDQQYGSLGARSPLHPVLLHALPADGMGEPQRWAVQSHFTNREASPNRFTLLCAFRGVVWTCWSETLYKCSEKLFSQLWQKAVSDWWVNSQSERSWDQSGLLKILSILT